MAENCPRDRLCRHTRINNLPSCFPSASHDGKGKFHRNSNRERFGISSFSSFLGEGDFNPSTAHFHKRTNRVDYFYCCFSLVVVSHSSRSRSSRCPTPTATSNPHTPSTSLPPESRTIPRPWMPSWTTSSAMDSTSGVYLTRRGMVV